MSKQSVSVAAANVETDAASTIKLGSAFPYPPTGVPLSDGKCALESSVEQCNSVVSNTADCCYIEGPASATTGFGNCNYTSHGTTVNSCSFAICPDNYAPYHCDYTSVGEFLTVSEDAIYSCKKFMSYMYAFYDSL